MSVIPNFDPWAPDCPGCGSLDVEVTDAGWKCPHCRGEGDAECIATIRIEVEEEVVAPAPPPQPITVDVEVPVTMPA